MYRHRVSHTVLLEERRDGAARVVQREGPGLGKVQCAWRAAASWDKREQNKDAQVLQQEMKR